MANRESDAGSGLHHGLQQPSEQHLAQQAFDQAKHQSRWHGGSSQLQGAETVSTEEPGRKDDGKPRPSFGLPPFDVIFHQDNPNDQRGNIDRRVDCLTKCVDSKYNNEPMLPWDGKLHHLQPYQAQKYGAYLEELVREHTYYNVREALHMMSRNLVPESMAQVGKAFEAANQGDHHPGSPYNNLPDVSVTTNGNQSLKNVKLKHFHGASHSTKDDWDMIFDQFTVYDGDS